MKKVRKTKELDEIQAISLFSIELATKETIADVLWAIVHDVVSHLDFVDCVIYRYHQERDELVQEAAYGQKNPRDTEISNRIVLKLGEGVVGSVARNGKSEIVADTSKDPRYIIDDAERLSELAVPIIIDGKLFGVIDSEHPNKYFFTETHVHLLTIVATLCAQRIRALGHKRKPLSRAKAYFEKLESLMRSRKIYRNPEFNLSTAAGLLGISAPYLSNLFNKAIEESFIDYINKYRVADAKRYLHRSDFEHYTIVSIGLEAGFKSKSAFYSAFKKHTGQTPTQFRKHP